MNIMRFIKIYIPTVMATIFGNFLTQGFILRGHNAQYLAPIIRPVGELLFPVLFLDYFFLAAVLVILLMHLRMEKKLVNGFLVGGLMGSVLLLQANLINLYILPRWPVEIAISDTISSFFSFGLAGLVAMYFLKKTD